MSNIYKYHTCISDMYSYKCAIFREHKMPNLTPVANHKLFFTWLYYLS